MKTLIVSIALIWVPVIGFAACDNCSPFKRGDANMSGTVDYSDAVLISNWLSSSGPAPDNMDAADADDSGAVNVTDVVRITQWLCCSGPAPEAPGPTTLGWDPTRDTLEEECDGTDSSGYYWADGWNTVDNLKYNNTETAFITVPATGGGFLPEWDTKTKNGEVNIVLGTPPATETFKGVQFETKMVACNDPVKAANAFKVVYDYCQGDSTPCGTPPSDSWVTIDGLASGAVKLVMQFTFDFQSGSGQDPCTCPENNGENAYWYPDMGNSDLGFLVDFEFKDSEDNTITGVFDPTKTLCSDAGLSEKYTAPFLGDACVVTPEGDEKGRVQWNNADMLSNPTTESVARILGTDLCGKLPVSGITQTEKLWLKKLTFHIGPLFYDHAYNDVSEDDLWVKSTFVPQKLGFVKETRTW